MFHWNDYGEYFYGINITALGISLMADGDPHEFYIQVVRDHYPEFQTIVGFPLDTSSKPLDTHVLHSVC